MQIPNFAAHKCQLINHIPRQLIFYALLKRFSYLKCYAFEEICSISSETERGIIVCLLCFFLAKLLCKNSEICFLQLHVLEIFSSNEFLFFFYKNQRIFFIAPK